MFLKEVEPALFEYFFENCILCNTFNIKILTDQALLQIIECGSLIGLLGRAIHQI